MFESLLIYLINLREDFYPVAVATFVVAPFAHEMIYRPGALYS